LSTEQKADVDFGFNIAKEVSRLEIGQTVVVKNGTVLAVEGFEGTDKCLARGGELAGKNGGAVAIKVARSITICASISRALGRNTRNVRGLWNFRSCAGSGKDSIARARYLRKIRG